MFTLQKKKCPCWGEEQWAKGGGRIRQGWPFCFCRVARDACSRISYLVVKSPVTAYLSDWVL